MCTAHAVTDGFCTRAQLGQFILDLPEGKLVNSTSFWSARLELPSKQGAGNDTNLSTSGFWNNPAGNPTPPPSNYNSPWRRQEPSSRISPTDRRRATDDNLTGFYSYKDPIQYRVKKTGYYCVGKFNFCLHSIELYQQRLFTAVVPVTVQSSLARATTDVPYHPSYRGLVLFKNSFDGKLPASDYPKVTVSITISCLSRAH